MSESVESAGGPETLPEAANSQPLIYVSTPLAVQLAIEQNVAAPWVDEVRAILASTRVAGPDVQCYSGSEIFDRHRDDVESDAATEEIYRLSSNAAWAYADALIIFRVRGGSTGVGIELAWACGLGIPILYLHPKGEVVSRLVRGLRREADLVITPVADSREAGEAVESFLTARMALIQDLARRRASWLSRVGPLKRTLAAAWEARTQAERFEVCGTARITEGRAERLVTQVAALAAAGFREVSALASALGVDFGSGPDLQPHQIQALSQTATEQGWSGADTLQLYEIGRLELRQPTQGKWGLATAPEWIELYDDYLGRRRNQRGKS